MRPKKEEGIADSVVPDQTAPLGAEEQSDLGLHRLTTPICPKNLRSCCNDCFSAQQHGDKWYG